MKYIFITDVHKYATNSIPCNFNPKDPKEIYLGDCLDLANCRKKEVDKIIKEYNDLKSVYGDRMVSGNHERMPDIGSCYVFDSEKNGRVFCTHGDREANENKWTAYRAKPKGAGFLKRGIWVNLLEAYEDIFDRKVRSEILDRMSARAISNYCKTYVCGHFHPSETIDLMHKGIRIIILKRGATTLDL